MLFLKLLGESFSFSIHALKANKLRTFLSLLGISIGIFAIISVFTVVDALESNVRKSVASLGNNVIYVQKWPWIFSSDYPWWKYINRPLPAYKELEVVQKRSTAAEASAFVVFINSKTVKFRNSSIENTALVGASHDYNKIKSFELSEGRYFTEAESNRGKPFAIIGADIAENLFPGKSPLDQEITVLGRKIKVIGVFKKEGESMVGNSSDQEIVIPVNYARTLVDLKSERIQPMIMVKGKENVSNYELIEELRGIMRSVRKLHPREEDSFALNQASLISAGLDSIFSVINMAGWLIGTFSILVGGFGIANIMFVSVKERTHIIGIQKSLGAKNYFILLQFLSESVILCLIGGLIGLFIVFLGTVAANLLFDIGIALTQGNIFLGLFVSATIGVISGFIPAYTASQMDPVEAIRTN